MSQGFIGEIRLFAGNFAPKSWAQCNGQLLPINQNQALFSILGTFYGGDGVSTFALPDLRSKLPIGTGSGGGLTPRTIGQTGGVETVSLAVSQLPQHSHVLTPVCNNATADATDPTGAFPGYPDPNVGGSMPLYASAATGNTHMSAGTSANTGGNQPHSNLQPALAVTFIICTQGYFPSRN